MGHLWSNCKSYLRFLPEDPDPEEPDEPLFLPELLPEELTELPLDLPEVR